MKHIPIFALAGVAAVLSVHSGAAQPAAFELSNANVDLAVDAQGRLVPFANPWSRFTPPFVNRFGPHRHWGAPPGEKHRRRNGGNGPNGLLARAAR